MCITRVLYISLNKISGKELTVDGGKSVFFKDVDRHHSVSP